MPVSDKDFRHALARLAGGVCIVATASGAQRRGITATAVCSVSASPPTILACVNNVTGTCGMIEAVGRFSVNLLAVHHRSVAEAFAGRDGRQGNDRFETGDWTRGTSGLPVLDGALASIECEVTQIVRAGTHAVFFGNVERVLFDDHTPLVYQDGQFRQLAEWLEREPHLVAPRTSAVCRAS